MQRGSLKIIIIIVISTLLLISAWFLVNDFLKYKNIFNDSSPENKILTQEDKLLILSQVSTETIQDTISETRKQNILEKVDTKTPVSSISYEEKLKILNSTQ